MVNAGMVGGGQTIYHICTRAEWQAAEAEGVYPGSSQDGADGFIHFSARDQVAVSAAKHRAGQDGLVLLSVDAGALDDALKWEKSRGGDGRSPDRDKQSRGGDGRSPDRDKQSRGGDGRSPDRDKQSRGGALFPHLYGPLPVAAVTSVDDLPLGPDGRHVFPPDLDLQVVGA